MKPKNKYQANILAMSKELTPLSKSMHNWTFENTIPHTGFRSKKGIVYCLSCGANFQHNLKDTKCKCTSCNRTIKLETTRARKKSFREFSMFLETYKGHQVARFIEVYAHCKANEVPRIFSQEIIQQWIDEKGKYTYVAKNRTFTYYVDSFGGDMEIRTDNHHEKYNIYPTAVYPKKSILPILKRNGFKSSLHQVYPKDLLVGLLTDSMSETLIKAKQFSLLGARHHYSRRNSVRHFWSSIKIAIRNNYLVKDAKMWFDNLKLIEELGLDLRNPDNLCPADLRVFHQQIIQRVNDQRAWSIFNKRTKRSIVQRAKKQIFWIVLRRSEYQNSSIEICFSIRKRGSYTWALCICKPILFKTRIPLFSRIGRTYICRDY